MADPWDARTRVVGDAEPDPWEARTRVVGEETPTSPSALRSEVGKRAAKSALDIGKGAGAEVLSTIFHGGDILRRGLGMDRVIERPDVKALITPPESLSGKVGSGLMTAAEFVLPAGAVGKGMKAIEAATAGGRAARIALWAARAAGEAGTAGAVETLRTGDIEKGKTSAVIGGAAAGAAPLLVPPGKFVVKTLTDLLGKSTGVGGEAIRVAATTASQKFKDAMRNRISETQIVDDTLSAVRSIRDRRQADYKQALSRLDQSILVPSKGLTDLVEQQLKSWKVKPMDPVSNEQRARLAKLWGAKLGPDATANRVQTLTDNQVSKLNSRLLDFSEAKLTNPGDQKLMHDAAKDVSSWTDMSPDGMDALKQRIYSYADSASDNVKPFFFRIGEAIRNRLETNVPGFKEMTSEYAKASKLLEDVIKELSARPDTPGALIRKISPSLNQNNDYRKIILEALDEAASTQLKETTAGYTLRSGVPRGLAGVGAGAALAYGLGVVHNPAYLASMAITSPRIMGETMALISVLRRATPMAVKQLPLSPLVPAVAAQLSPPPR